MRTSLVPEKLPICIAAFVAGMVDRDFRRCVVAAGLVEMSDCGRVTLDSLERHLGYQITPERYLAADRKRDSARRYQAEYWPVAGGNLSPAWS